MATKNLPTPDERDEVLDILLEGSHARTIRDGHRRWSSGELMEQGVTRAQFERSIRDLEADFKKTMQARNLWRFRAKPTRRNNRRPPVDFRCSTTPA